MNTYLVILGFIIFFFKYNLHFSWNDHKTVVDIFMYFIKSVFCIHQSMGEHSSLKVVKTSENMFSNNFCKCVNLIIQYSQILVHPHEITFHFCIYESTSEVLFPATSNYSWSYNKHSTHTFTTIFYYYKGCKIWSEKIVFLVQYDLQ